MKIKEVISDLRFMKKICTDEHCEKSIDTAIISLEAWKNMKNELEEFLGNLRELHDWGRELGAEQALDIVNKYLQEVEE